MKELARDSPSLYLLQVLDIYEQIVTLGPEHNINNIVIQMNCIMN